MEVMEGLCREVQMLAQDLHQVLEVQEPEGGQSIPTRCRHVAPPLAGQRC